MSSSKLSFLKYKSLGFLPHDRDAILVHNLTLGGFNTDKTEGNEQEKAPR